MPSRLGHQAALAVQELVEGAVAPSERWVQYYADKILAAIEKATDQVMIWREHNRDSAEGRSAGREDYLKLWTQHIEQCSTDRLVLLVQADPRESTAGSYDSDRGQLVYYVPASFFDTANGKEKDFVRLMRRRITEVVRHELVHKRQSVKLNAKEYARKIKARREGVDYKPLSDRAFNQAKHRGLRKKYRELRAKNPEDEYGQRFRDFESKKVGLYYPTVNEVMARAHEAVMSMHDAGNSKNDILRRLAKNSQRYHGHDAVGAKMDKGYAFYNGSDAKVQAMGQRFLKYAYQYAQMLPESEDVNNVVRTLMD